MKNVIRLMVVLLVIGTSGFLMAGACDNPADALEDPCGPCGKVANGDVTITGSAQVDGVLKAISTLDMSAGSIQADFDAKVRAMATGVFGLDVTGKATADIITEIEGAFQTQIAANLQGGLKVNYQAPKCEANVDVAVSAQAQCEAKVDANCSADVECTGGEVSVKCEGKCEGSCSGTCSVPSCTVAIDPGGAACSGKCEGSCSVELTAAAACDGKCEGTCDGNCSAYVENASGEMECSGSCSGNCQGSCKVEGEAAASCTGTCQGSCKVEGPDASASCTGTAGCSGSCDAECSGGCEGTASAPKCTGKAECNAEASGKCEAQASAQASASVKCSPPSLSIDFNFAAGVDANGQATVITKLEKFKVEMVGILQGMAQLKALVEARTEGDITIQPPVVTIAAQVSALASAVGSGTIEFQAPILALCAPDAVAEAGTILNGVAGKVSGTIQGQMRLAALISI